MIEYEETEEDKICPWDYGPQFYENEQEDDDEEYIFDQGGGEESESSWSEGEGQFQIASSLKRPGGSLLRSRQTLLSFIFSRSCATPEPLEYESNLIKTLRLQRLDEKFIAHLLRAVKRFILIYPS